MSKKNLSLILISAFWLFAVFNPVFKKYDYGAEFPSVILFGVILAFLVYFEFRQKRERSLMDKLFLLLFLSFYILSFVFSQTKNVGFSEVLAISSLVTVYILYSNKKIEWMDKFLEVVGVATIVAVLIAFVLYFFRAEPRMTGPFFNLLYHANNWPNAFALFLLMVWPIYLILFREKYNYLTAFALGFAISALFLTYSRGALLVFFGQLILMLLYFRGRINKRIWGTILLTVVVALGITFYANYIRGISHENIDIVEKATFGNNEALTSGQERLDFWEGAIQLTAEKPIFGWGPFSFRYAYNPLQQTFLGNSDHPHNMFLKISSENGVIALVGLFGFLIFLLVLVLSRFSDLSQKRKDHVFLLGVAVIGCFAHNLIDYNLNFFANILLLFIFLAFIRSLVVKKESKDRKAILAVILVVPIVFLSLYEGFLLGLSYTFSKDFLQYSLFPREYYLSAGEDALKVLDDPTKALQYAQKELSLNDLDPYAWNLRGDALCSAKSQETDVSKCEEAYAQAIALDPLNEFEFYRDYLKVAVLNGLDPAEKSIMKKTEVLLNDYFNYVKNNVHFTAYTQNVEAAAEVIDIISPYLDKEESAALISEKYDMLQTAKTLRDNKTF